MHFTNASHQDIPRIRQIVDETWPVAYGSILKKEQIDYMIGLFYSNDALAKQMKEGHQFFLAIHQDAIAGFAGIETDILPGITKLHKLYILPSLQGNGIGRALLQHTEATARNLGQQKMILNVNRYNNALFFYQKASYRIYKEEDIPIGNHFFMNDFLMEKALTTVKPSN